MTVLILIGLAIFAWSLLMIVKKANQVTLKKYNQAIFDSASAYTYIIGYFLIAGSIFFYPEILKLSSVNGDNLNGYILSIIGIFFFLANILRNASYMSGTDTVMYSILQIFIYFFASIAAAAIIFILLAIFSETKPVYNINDRDR